jgi:hypothetical protein
MLLQTYPLLTCGATLVAIVALRTLSIRTTRRRREAVLRTKVLAMCAQVHDELYKTQQQCPVHSDIIFSRIAFAQYPASQAKRQDLKRTIWPLVETQIQTDARICVNHRGGVDGAGRPITTWQWVDPNRPIDME